MKRLRIRWRLAEIEQAEREGRLADDVSNVPSIEDQIG